MDKQLPSRHQQILDMVQDKGYVAIERLAQHFSVTPQTIRRDINQMSAEGLLRRYHGGAGPNTSARNTTYAIRRSWCSEEKIRMAQLVAAHIPNHASLFLDIGTSTEEVARALLSKSGIRVITNNINVATIMSANAEFEIFLSGGIVRNHDLGITGEATIAFINQFKVDFGIISVAGIDPDGTLIDFDYNEVQVTRAIIANSRKVFLVADHTKFGRSAMARIGHISEIHALFTDDDPPEDFAAMITESGVKVHIADTGPAITLV